MGVNSGGEIGATNFTPTYLLLGTAYELSPKELLLLA